MKIITQILLLVVLANNVMAQGFLKKLKDKVTSAAQGKATNTATAATSTDGNFTFTDPAKYGNPVLQISKKDMDAASDGFILYFEGAQVVNGQVTAKVNFNGDVYSYTGGQLQKTGDKPSVGYANIFNASEKDIMSVDMTQVDQQNAILKSGPHISSGTIPGKINQDLTFNGKVFASYGSFNIMRNKDSTIIAAAGANFSPGKLAYTLTTSNGQSVKIPMNQKLLLSPDGSVAGNFLQAGIIRDDPSISAAMKASGAYVYLTNGKTITIANYADANTGMWLSNMGSVFAIDGTNNKAVKRNDTLLFASDAPVDMKQFFIGRDEKNWAWEGSRDLHFSDGTVFQDVFNAYRVYVNNKDVILFLKVKDQQVFFCQKEL